MGIMNPTGDTMQIHLCKPGGQQEGPYALEQIRRDLAANKYRDTDYWAWHEGLPEWVPLYLIPGVSADDTAAAPESARVEPPVRAQAAPPAAPTPAVAAMPSRAGTPQPLAEAAPRTAAAAARIAISSGPQGTTPSARPPLADRSVATTDPVPGPEPEEAPAPAGAQVSSGMPVSALEQVFMFTTGDGPSAWQSPTVARMLKEIVGEDLSTLHAEVMRDVVAWCAVGELLKPDGSISEAVWRAMAVHRPMLIQQAREKLYRVCVRTFRIEADTTVALVLFYNKQKL